MEMAIKLLKVHSINSKNVGKYCWLVVKMVCNPSFQGKNGLEVKMDCKKMNLGAYGLFLAYFKTQIENFVLTWCPKLWLQPQWPLVVHLRSL